MALFRCIGPDCEDTCCRDWRIGLDEDDYRNVASVCAREDIPAESVLGKAVPDSKKPFGYGMLDLTKRGSCHFLEDGFCAIQRDFGAALMPKSCVAYPRWITRFPDRFEMSGSLSCPELARLCLLAKNDALERVPEESVSDRWIVNEVVQPDRHAFEKRYDNIQDWIVFFLQYPGFPLAERLFLIARFAKKTISFLGKEHGGSPDDRLLTLAARFDDEPYLEKLLAVWRRKSEPGEASFRWLGETIMPRAGTDQRTNYLCLWRAILSETELGRGVSFKEIAERHRVRDRRLQRRFGMRITDYFMRYAVHHWRRHPFTHFPDLYTAVKYFAIHHAALRFLFVNHGDLDPILLGSSEETALAVLDRTMVSVTQTFLRTAEHDRPFTKKLEVAARDHRIPLSDLILL